MRRRKIGLDDALCDHVVATTLRDDAILARLREAAASPASSCLPAMA